MKLCVNTSTSLFLKGWRVSSFCSFIRCMSVASGVKVKHINSNIQLMQKDGADDKRSATNKRPLMLLFGWMLAKRKHLNKYGNMYISKGFDVITIQVKPYQILIPTQIQKVIQNVLDLLEQDSKTPRRSIMVHGFSVGGYVYGEMLVKLKNESDRYDAIQKGLRGQIFDSPVDFDGIPKGFSSALTKNHMVRGVMRNLLEGYLRFFQQSISSHYIRSSNTFKSNDLQLPSLMVYSHSDPVCDPEAIESLGKQWRMRNIHSVTKHFEDSKHVSIFYKHPEEYVETILKFLDDIGLEEHRSEDFEKVENVLKM
ncbi:hypothetical protein CHS0354_002799 [Potamilus streckersoni]|uniref:Uncharacterized protein n=1 Tax=Potamilus streckersoni TaxID=2493646 RepID=A0AAE0S781_9BIVA|nr:hypothetical protein CHS0354_002799 [Potamilus streckersoni]